MRAAYLINTAISVAYIEALKYVYSCGYQWVAFGMAILWPILVWRCAKGSRSTFCSDNEKDFSDQARKDSMFIGCAVFIVYLCVCSNSNSEQAKNILYYIGGATVVMIWFFGGTSSRK